MKKQTQDDPSMSKLIGETYAYFQHGVDKVIEWGFDKMNQAADAPAPAKAEPESEMAAKAKRFAKGTAKFLSSTVSAYYETYKDLKKKDAK